MSFGPIVLYYYHCIIFTYTNISGNLRVYLSRIPYQILKEWIHIYRRNLGNCTHTGLSSVKASRDWSSDVCSSDLTMQ